MAGVFLFHRVSSLVHPRGVSMLARTPFPTARPEIPRHDPTHGHGFPTASTHTHARARLYAMLYHEMSYPRQRPL